MAFPDTSSTLIRNDCDVFSLSRLENVTCSQSDSRLILESKHTVVHKFVSEIDLQVFNSEKLYEMYVPASVRGVSIFQCASYIVTQ